MWEREEKIRKANGIKVQKMEAVMVVGEMQLEQEEL